MTSGKRITIGVLALQGAFREHIQHLNNLFSNIKENLSYSEYELSVKPIRKPEDLEDVNGLIIGGGESTTISILLQRSGLLRPLQELIQKQKLPTWGTCAGLILLCDEVTNTKIELGDLDYKVIGGLDVSVKRNSFGRQLESFTESIPCHSFTNGQIKTFDCVFIRAPVITGTEITVNKSLKEGTVVSGRVQSLGEAPTKVLAIVERDEHKLIVAVRKGRILGTSFHPELVEDYAFHKWFLDEFVLRNTV